VPKPLTKKLAEVRKKLFDAPRDVRDDLRSGEGNDSPAQLRERSTLAEILLPLTFLQMIAGPVAEDCESLLNEGKVDPRNHFTVDVRNSILQVKAWELVPLAPEFSPKYFFNRRFRARCGIQGAATCGRGMRE
jgi:hypothetical protein